MAVTLTWLNYGVQRDASMFLNLGLGWAIGDLIADLYVNNHPPVVTDTTLNYTKCTLAGYGAITLTGANWLGATVGGISDWTYPAITFNFAAGGQTIYGVVIFDPTHTFPLMAGLLDTPFVVPVGGGSLTVNLEEIFKQC